jgi:hypothetical protein
MLGSSFPFQGRGSLPIQGRPPPALASANQDQCISNFSFDFKQKDLYIRNRRFPAAHLLKSCAVEVQLLKVEDN